MHAATFALAFAFLPSVLSQNVFKVQVGADGKLAYDPPFITGVKQGDFVDFIFNPKNHTVTQSSFDTPCSALAGGAKTGFVPVSAGTSAANLPVRRFPIPQDTTPIWFYCGQTGHCGQGMVFAINPPADPAPNSFSAFQQKAIAQGSTTTAPPPAWSTATATVTFGGSVYTTTYTSYAGTPPPTPAANPTTHKITVGLGGLVYSPANISAEIGDTVTFEFHPVNHTVTQSSFLNPCQSLEQTTGKPGFKSGFVPVDASVTDFPTFSIKINDTAPIWGYCGQVNHCQQGMVFSINAVESGPNNFAAFQQLALQSGNATSSTGSGDNSPSGFSTSGGPAATGTTTGTNSAIRSSNSGYTSILVASFVALFTLAL